MRFLIHRPNNVVVVDNAYYPLDTSSLDDNIFFVAFDCDIGAGGIQYTDQPNFASLADPSPYQSFINSWLAAAAAGNPALTLAQAQQIKSDLIDAIYLANVGLPIDYTVAAGAYTWECSPSAIANMNAGLSTAAAVGIDNYNPDAMTGTIGNPVSLGTSNSTNANASSVTITTTAAVLVGDLLVSFWAVPTSTVGQHITGVTDGTNVYQFLGTIAAGTADRLECWICINAQAKASSASLTATLSGTSTGGNGYHAVAARVANASVTPLDQIIINKLDPAVAPVSLTTGTLSRSSEILFGAGEYNANNPIAVSPGFTNLTAAVGNFSFSVDWKVVTTVAPITWAPTSTTTAIWGMMLVGFKATLLTPTLASVSLIPLGHTSAVSVTGNELIGLLGAISARNIAWNINRAVLKTSLAAAVTVGQVIALDITAGWPGMMWPAPASLTLTPQKAVANRFWPGAAAMTLTPS